MALRQGIDVSHYQGKIDWNKVRAAGKEFAIMKAMYEGSGKIEDTFEYNYAGAGAAGMDRGAYIFIASRSLKDPKRDAEDFLRILNGRKLELGIWLDLEAASLRSAGIDKIVELVRIETELFNKAGYTVGIYSNVDWWNNVLKSEWLKSNFKFWIARYPANDDGSMKGSLSPRNSIPVSIGWQYSSKGRVDGINGNVDLNVFWGDVCKEKSEVQQVTMGVTADAVVGQARKWVGRKESDGSHKEIIDVYNSQQKLPRGYKVKYTDAWCATFVTACAVKQFATAIIPPECGCQAMINEFIRIGCWQEDESVVPSAGWIIFYDWDDNGVGDNKGYSDHVGIVESVNGNDITVIEGNISNSVGRRHIKVNAKYIRGYGVPKYSEHSVKTAPDTPQSVQTKLDIETVARQVINGDWGSGAARKAKLTEAGYDYSAVQSMVNAILKQPAQAQPKFYTVQKGDTLSKIALMFDTTVEAIAQANGIINKNMIMTGQKLRVN